MKPNFNSHDTSWQGTAKIFLNAYNGGNEQDSSKIAGDTLHEIQRRIFWCSKNVPKNFFSGNFTENESKMTEIDIFRTANRVFGYINHVNFNL